MVKSKSSLLKRVLVAVIAIPVVIWLLYLGGIYFSILVAVISLVGYYEFINKTIKVDIKRIKILFFIFAIIYQLVQVMTVLHLSEKFSNQYILPGILFSCFLLIFIFGLLGGSILYFKKTRMKFILNDLGMYFLGFFYTQVLFSFLILIRNLETGLTGFYWVLFMLVMIWINDSLAYFGGMLFGRHKLAPVISPNKTIEGFFVSFLITPVFAIVFHLILNFPKNLFFAIIFGFIISIFAMIGDLIESAFKRSLGIKDFGNILPGHGGVLDRFDSVLIVGPTLYILILFFNLPGAIT